MQGPAKQPGGGPRPSLAQRAFPRRVRMLLEGVLEYASDELDRGIATTLNELEQQLFKQAEQARSNEMQKASLEALREIKRGRPDLAPRFLLALEAALATIKDPPPPEAVNDAPPSLKNLSLVDEGVMDENIALNEIAARAEIRNSLPLFLLGQRFGVIAGRPAFDAETLPVGPHRITRMLREAAGCFDLGADFRLQLFRQFDRSVMQFIGPLYETINTYLVRQRVLPNLTYVPVRAKHGGRDAAAPPAAAKPAAPDARTSPPRSKDAGNAPAAAPARGPAARGSGFAGSAGTGPAPVAGTHGGTPLREAAHAGGAAAGAAVPGAGGAMHPGASAAAAAAPAAAGAAPAQAHAPSTASGPRPLTSWPGVPAPSNAPSATAAQAEQDTEMFDVLRQLLAGRRSLLGKLGNTKAPQSAAPAYVASQREVQQMLGALQGKPAAPVVVDGKPQPRSVTHLKQDLLSQLRKVAPDGHAPSLTDEHGDTIDLVGMLFDHIMKDVRPNSPAATLLNKLQVPLLRVALDDKGFFTRKQHPARQMLNTIAESGAYWSSDDEADRGVVEKMNMLVDRVSTEFSGDLNLFDTLLTDLNGHMQTQARKAEVAERRHVEAARGREKLELARLKAAEAIDTKLAGKAIPKFLHQLLAQSWSDVLALSLLRGGEESDTFKHQLGIAERLIDSAVARRRTGQPLITPTDVPAMKTEIEESLAQVGYHGNDAQQISTRLLAASGEEEDDDPASRTELAMKLKSRARLGQNVDGSGPAGEKLAPLDAAEKACLEQLRHLPFGTWFEFVVNQQGEVARRRLSWYSTVTGHCLFVNHRGQRVGEYSLNWLAREQHRGNVRIMQAEQESLIDKAWSAIVGALRSFAGKPGAPAAPAAAT